MEPRTTRSLPRICVIGAGHGGSAMAAHLALMGLPVRLFNRSEARLRPILALGGIELITRDIEDAPYGLAEPELVTTNLAEALEGAALVMVATKRNGHRSIAEQCAPYLRDGQVVVLNPGITCGAIEFHSVLREAGVKADVTIAEAQTFIYQSRMLNPAQVRIQRIKNGIPVAAIPASRTPEVVRLLNAAYPQFVAGENVINTSFDNVGSAFAPAVTVLNAGRIESTHGDFEYYVEGVTPSVARILEAVDRERVAVAAGLGFRSISAREWLSVAYDATGSNLYEAMKSNRGYQGIKSPLTTNHPFITEDVPMTLVPIASLGERVGVPTPAVRAIIHLASLLHDTDYWREGRTVERLGLSGWSVEQIRALVLGE
ncbi:MAG: NAD/NADP octopine/nopaline dehydrogenase family protein [Armatimonadetes bacterium]|nr:NAD/NADP octopine/nopaline dehydrogenase family protein [Armatimonadota bacterium]